jgi:hypothetical protein
MTDDSIVVVSPDQFTSDLQGELLVLNAASGFYFGLEAVGKRIWNLLQEPRRISAMRDVLLEEFDVESERCTRDLKAFLQELAQHGLIKVYVTPTA